MTIEKDSVLQSLFDSAPRAAPSESVVAGIKRRIDRQRRRTVFGWSLAGIVLLALAWWLSGPVTALFVFAARLMPDSLIHFESAWLNQLLAPVNGLAGIAGLVFLLAWWLFRKLRA